MAIDIDEIREKLQAEQHANLAKHVDMATHAYVGGALSNCMGQLVPHDPVQMIRSLIDQRQRELARYEELLFLIETSKEAARVYELCRQYGV